MGESDASPATGGAPSLSFSVKEVRRGLAERGVPGPAVLLWLATGSDFLEGRFEDAIDVRLGELDACPEVWRDSVLHAGTREGLVVWAIEDLGAETACSQGPPSWLAGFPAWLAAQAGARLCLHASAGSATRAPGAANPERRFLFTRDHINWSGQNPLVGLGESELGPLFPDLSRLHHDALRRAALERARALELAAEEGVVICTAGPALETPAERRMHLALGADASVQSLAAPLIACAHAGLPVLSLVCLLPLEGEGSAAVDVSRLTARALEALPDQQRLILALLEDLAQALQDIPSETA